MKKILAISLMVLLLFTSIAVITTINVHASTKSIEQRVKDLLEKGDTINEALSIATMKEIKESKFLSKLLEKSEEQREEDLKRYEEMEKNERGELTEYDVESLCGASEDFEAHEEECRKLYGMLERGEIEDDPDYEYR